ncbi:hypothetical protein HZA39_00340 [Candidatus Peregrinibacteria bacterium]|nr:hypothetical protein [Candidatus Peregrinibacteria bacterium]
MDKIDRRNFLILIPAGAASAFISCEKEPEPFNESSPVQPKMPSLSGEIKREPIHLIIGVDITRSKIKKLLPDVLKSTSDFLKETGILQDGDKITICEVSDNAACYPYVKGTKDSELLNKVNSIKTLDAGGRTHLLTSLETMSGQSSDPNTIIALWSDCDNSDEWDDTDKEKGDIKHQLKLVIPSSEFQENAKELSEAIAGTSPSIHVAKTGNDFGNLLTDITDKLEKEARAKAEVDRNLEYEKMIKEYQQALQDWEKQKADWEKRRQEYEANRQRKMAEIKRAIKFTIFGISSAVLALIGLTIGIIHRRNRKKAMSLKDCVLIQEGEYKITYNFPNKLEYEINKFDSGFPKMKFVKDKDGDVYIVEESSKRKVGNGEEIAQGIKFYHRDPSLNEEV